MKKPTTFSTPGNCGLGLISWSLTLFYLMASIGLLGLFLLVVVSEKQDAAQKLLSSGFVKDTPSTSP